MGLTLSKPWTAILGRHVTGRAQVTPHVGGGVVGAAPCAAGAACERRGVAVAALLVRPMAKGRRCHLLCKQRSLTVTECQRQRATCRRCSVGDEGAGGAVLPAVARRCGLRRLLPQAVTKAAKVGRPLSVMVGRPPTVKVGRPPTVKEQGLGRWLMARRGWALMEPPGAGERAAVGAAEVV